METRITEMGRWGFWSEAEHLFCGFSDPLQPVIILERFVGFDAVIETIWFGVEIQDPSDLSRLSFIQRIFAESVVLGTETRNAFNLVENA